MARYKQKEATVFSLIKLRGNYKPFLYSFFGICVGFLVSGAQIFNSISSFGVAGFCVLFYKALDGCKKENVFDFTFEISSLISIFAGYILFGSDTLKYISCIIICCFSIRLIKKHTSFNNETVIIMSLSFLSTLACGLFVSYLYSNNLSDILYAFGDSIIALSFGYFFLVTYNVLIKGKLSKITQVQSVCMLLSMCIVLCALNMFTIASFSPARVISILIIMILSAYTSISLATMSSVVLGLCLSISSPANSVLAIYPVSALTCAVFAPVVKAGGAMCFLLTNAVLSLYIGGTEQFLTSIYESVFAGAIFLLIPQKIAYTPVIKALSISSPAENAEKNENKLKSVFSAKLNQASKSFLEISGYLTNQLEKEKASKNERHIYSITEAFDDTCNKVCRHCSKYCLNNEYSKVIDVFNSMYEKYAAKGVIETSDLPDHFEKSCCCSSNIVSQLNKNFNRILISKQLDKKIVENQSSLATQFSSFSNIIDKIADDINENVIYLYDLETALSSKVISEFAHNYEVSCFVNTDKLTNICTTLYNPYDKFDLLAYMKQIERFCGCPLDVSLYRQNETSVVANFAEKSGYTVKFATSSLKKQSESSCGDTSCAFRAYENKYVMAISDGMGSGTEAAKDSHLTIKLLESFMQSGIDKDSALNLISSTLLMKSNDEAFVTLDLAMINLVSGICEFYKAGAASSFIKRAEKVYELGCSNLPAGILASTSFEKTRVSLKQGDMIIMASDGLLENGSKWLSTLLSTIKTDSPFDIADSIINGAKENGVKSDDDITVCVAYIDAA